MFTGENRQILQTLIDNNKITETDQRTPILALKAIQTAIENKEHHQHDRNKKSTKMATKSATTTTKSSTKCPWRQFYKRIIKYMDSLHAEPCKPQTKIDTFVTAIRNSFPSPIVDIEQSKKSTKQTQTTEQNPSNNTKRTANSETIDTDSAYNTESESNYTECLPRPSKSQQITNTKHIQGTRPSRIPIPTKSNSKTSHRNTSTHQPKPSTSTWPDTQTTVKQPILPAPKTSTAPTYPQHTRKTPLLPTPPSPVRNFNYSSHYKQYITRPSAFNNRNPAFTRPSPNRLYNQYIPRPSPSPPTYNTHPTFSGPANYSYYLQPHLPGPHTAFPPYLHQNLITGPYQQTPLLPAPYQQTSGHFPQWVYYVPIILPHYTIWRKN